jgi:uncharacterized RDD family membrane protein YckC
VKSSLPFSRLLIVSLLATFPVGAGAEVRSNDLLANGSDERFWIARYETTSEGRSNNSPPTIFYFRGPGDSNFVRFPYTGDRVSSLAHRGTQLAAVLAGGNWIMASEDGTSSEGPALPDGARLIDLAGGDDTFWAIGSAGVLPGTTTSAPATATSPTSASTSPATTQATAVPPAFYKLDNGVWESIAPIPREAILGSVPASLTIIDHVPYIAFPDEAHAIRVVGLDSSTWKTIAVLSGDGAVTSARLLRGTAVPVVWIARAKGSDTLDFLEEPRPPQHVVLSFVPSSAQDRAVAYALGRIRVLFGTGKTLSEQDLDASNGNISGTVIPVVFQTEIPVYGIFHAMQYVIWTALFLAIVGAMRFRRQMQGMVFDLEKIHLAPLGRRLSAGVIDLFPLVIGIAIFEGPISDQTRELVLAVSTGLYLLHTATSEMLTGRSLGKWLMGLRVVSLTGERPPWLALLLRNLLRVIDVGLLFVPLIVVVISPLRQRTGDVAAGTLVIQSD